MNAVFLKEFIRIAHKRRLELEIRQKQKAYVVFLQYGGESAGANTSN